MLISIFWKRVRRTWPVIVFLIAGPALSAAWQSVQAQSGSNPTVLPELPDGYAGVPYSSNLSVDSPRIVSGALPPGLTLIVADHATPVISGVPTTQGMYTFTIEYDYIVDIRHETAMQDFTISIVPIPPIQIVTANLPNGHVDESYRAESEFTGGAAPYTGIVISGTLPPGLSLSLKGKSFVISGIPTTPGSFPFTVQIADNYGDVAQATYTIQVSTLQFLTSSVPDGMIGESYSADIQVGGGVPPYVWTVSDGVLPYGLSLNSTTGGISGTPTTAGLFSFVVSIADSTGVSFEATFTPTINLPDGWVGISYNAPLYSYSPCTSYLTGLYGSGITGSGTTLNGVPLHGIPINGGYYSITFVRSSSSGLHQCGTLSFTIHNPVPVLTDVSPGEASAGSAAFTVTVSGSDFVPSSIVQWNGSDLATHFGSSTELTAQVPTAAILYDGTASVMVINPAPSGGTSNALSFAVLPNQPPVVDAGGPYSVYEGEWVSIRVTGSDPEGGSLTYSWDLDNDGNFLETLSGGRYFGGLVGPSVIGVKVTDSYGLTATDTAVVEVLDVPDAPTGLTATAVSTTDVLLAWTDVSEGATMVRIERIGAPLMDIVPADHTTDPNRPRDPIYDYHPPSHWEDVGSGGATWAEISTTIDASTSYLDSGLMCDYLYYYRIRTYHANEGVFSFYSEQAPVKLYCVPPNEPPNAIGDNYLVDEDGILSNNVLANDTDAESDPLTAIRMSDPANGTLILNADGSFSYTPNANFNGMDSFTYKANDGSADSNQATVTITVRAVNDTPLVISPGDQSHSEGANVTLAIAAIDIDDLTLSYSASGLPAGLSINQASGVIEGMIDYSAAQNIPYVVTITATDGQGATGSATFTWTVLNVNRPPTMSILGDQTSSEGQTVALPILAIDPDGDPLSYSAGNLPSGLSMVPATGFIGGVLDFSAAQNSPYAVTLSATDGQGAVGSTTFTWTVLNTNRPPNITSSPGDQTNTEGDGISVSVAASDPDGDPLTYSASGLPAGLSINGATGLISGTVAGGASAGSPYAVTVIVSDGGLTASAAFSWTINPVMVAIDIKPGETPNCFNNDGHGVIPVAILGSATFDVSQVDATTVRLEGLAVRVVGRQGNVQAHSEDVNGDGFTDLVIQIADEDGAFDTGNGTATLTATLFNGTRIVGRDSICIAPR